ncbi:MAG: hypothetical protein KAT68_19530 [Bacteroidales bacterium]|nr:hypothetical protein [Bacteroidales bacterium]
MRYTIKNLRTFTDYELLQSIITNRRHTCTNYYTPLYKRLTELINKLKNKEELTK